MSSPIVIDRTRRLEEAPLASCRGRAGGQTHRMEPLGSGARVLKWFHGFELTYIKRVGEGEQDLADTVRSATLPPALRRGAGVRQQARLVHDQQGAVIDAEIARVAQVPRGVVDKRQISSGECSCALSTSPGPPPSEPRVQFSLAQLRQNGNVKDGSPRCRSSGPLRAPGSCTFRSSSGPD